MEKNNINYEELSNSEIKIKMNELENEYEHIKLIVNDYLSKMEILNDKYIKLKNILNKRIKGIM